jgi:branched-chain amino acid transport system substrate-binding protein
MKSTMVATRIALTIMIDVDMIGWEFTGYPPVASNNRCPSSKFDHHMNKLSHFFGRSGTISAEIRKDFEMKYQTLAGLMAILMLLLVVGCGDDDCDSNCGGAPDIPVGLLIPYTGDLGWVSNAENGVLLALGEINDEAGGIRTADGSARQISLHREDTATVNETSVAGAQRLLDDLNVVALIGPTSSTVLSILPLALEAGVVEISPTAGTTALDARGGCVADECIFRTVSSDVVMGSGMAWYAGEVLAAEKVALFFTDDEGAGSIREVVREAVGVLGLQIVGETVYQTGQASYAEKLQEIQSGDPDVILFESNGEDAAVFLREWNEAADGGAWVGTDTVVVSFVETSAPHSEGVYSVNPGPLPGAAFDAWLENYEDVKGSTGLDTFGANFYDALNLIALALEQGGEVSRGTVRANIREIAAPPGELCRSFPACAALLRAGSEIDYDGVAGPHDFNEFGDTVTPLKAERVVDGQLVRQMSITETEIGDVIEGVLAGR